MYLRAPKWKRARVKGPDRGSVRGCSVVQAEDGIRDVAVTGVQTCALPIWPGAPRIGQLRAAAGDQAAPGRALADVSSTRQVRSEERRVGKEGRPRWAP